MNYEYHALNRNMSVCLLTEDTRYKRAILRMSVKTMIKPAIGIPTRMTAHNVHII